LQNGTISHDYESKSLGKMIKKRGRRKGHLEFNSLIFFVGCDSDFLEFNQWFKVYIWRLGSLITGLLTHQSHSPNPSMTNV